MAEELRWETLASTALVDTNAFGEFRNDTAADLFIRSVDMDFKYANTTATTAANDGQLQLSKSNTVDNVNNSSIYQLNLGGIGMNDEAAGVGPAGTSTVLNKLYAKGQLILEPGESVFAHLNFTNSPTSVRANVTIGYHF